MNNFDLTNIKAVAFDIDGTLYRAWKLNSRMSLYFLPHCFFFLKYGLVRNLLRKNPNKLPDFMETQASYMAKKMKCSTEEAKQKLDKIVYKGIAKFFKKIKPCKDSIEFIKELKEKGYKIGILSDFPPEQKGDIWGIKDICDCVLGTEETGALKPSPVPFRALATALDIKEEEILFVGNSHKYDVTGSKNAGMKAAWIITPFQKLFGKKSNIADITFCHYKELKALFFNNENKTN